MAENKTIKNENPYDASNNKLTNQLKKMYDKLSIMQKVIIGSSTIASFVILMLIISWASSVNYALLFSNLDPKDASDIVTKLQESKVEYKLDANGTMIYVDKKKLYDIRLSLASEGLPGTSDTGYSIFDDNKFGMTDFMQRLNKKRALEGELTKSITTIKEVQSARVHIVIPKRSLFEEDKHEATASVILNIKNRNSLRVQQINGIVNLISNAVEGLSGQNISIIDNYGNELNQHDDPLSVSGATTSQYKTQKMVENKLEKQAQSLLNKILGLNKSIVKVSAKLNFEKIERTLEEYDPEKQVLRSEERHDHSENSQAGNNKTDESSTSNYEINKSVSVVNSEVGNIKKLSIAVSIDGIYEKTTDEDGKERTVYKARSDDELNKLKAIVKSSLGFDENRGDVIEITNLKFAHDTDSFEPANGLNSETIDLIKTSIKYIGIILLVLIILIVFKTLLKKSKEFSSEIWPKLISDKVSSKIMTPEGEIIDASELLKREKIMAKSKKKKSTSEISDEMSEESLDKMNLQKSIQNFAIKNGEDASSLLKSWLYENGELLEN